MKLLIVVKSEHRPKTFADNSLIFISRSGFEYRINVKRTSYQRYINAIIDSELENYLFVPRTNIKKRWAKIPAKFDLVLHMPDNVRGFTEKSLFEFVKEVNRLRSEFKDPEVNTAGSFFNDKLLLMEKLYDRNP